MLSIVVFTTIKLGPQNRAGPLESSRHLGFDDRADWNQFYDSEAGRRFEELAFKADAADIVARRSADEPLQVTWPVAAAGAAPPEDAAEQAAETSRLTSQDLPLQHLSDQSAELSQPLSAADAAAEREPGPTAALAGPRQIAAESATREADQAPANLRGRILDGASSSITPELATAAAVPAPLPESASASTAPAHLPLPALTSASPSPVPAAEQIKAASSAADEPGETAALAPAPAAAARTPVWQDEPLFMIEDETQTASTADGLAIAPASGGVTGNDQETPPAVKAPAAKRIVPRARKFAPAARTVVRASAPLRVRASPPRRRVAAPRRSAPRPQLDQHFSGESYYNYPDYYAPRERAPRRPARRQRQDDPFGQSFGPPAGAYGG